MIGRWKMLDNLRRTLSAPACVFALLAGWPLPFRPPLVWTAFFALAMLLPVALPGPRRHRRDRPGVTLRSHLRALGADLGSRWSQIGLLITSWRTRRG